MRVLLLTPPMTQLNAPYPAMTFLTGFLRARGVECAQADLAIEVVLRLFSRRGLELAMSRLPRRKGAASVAHFRENFPRMSSAIDPTIRFLQGRDPTLALRIASREFLPEGPRFAALDAMGCDGEETLHRAFGSLGTQDRARYLATLFLADIADAIRDGIDPHFELSRYAEKLAMSAPTFDPLRDALLSTPTLVDEILADLAREKVMRHEPDLVCVSAPFPGNVYGAFRIAQAIRAAKPGIRIAFGGGYVNTELRELSDPRVFDFFDFVCLDDGERSLPRLIDFVAERIPAGKMCKTFARENGRVVFHHDESAPPVPHSQCGTPTYDGLPLDGYLQVFDTLNPMHRIWSDGRWNKIMIAHGCYWAKCSFCDTKLEYIDRYSTAPADHLVDQMIAMIRETGQTGFHFVDEAAPPAMLRKLADRLIERGVTATWWGNIRFDSFFTREVCETMACAGCVAVTGGLEVAEDRLLKLMQKGVSVGQVARVTRNFTDAGIMVHAYLMYGFPTQTAQETVNALEYVRQLFAAGCLQSAYWHRFALTVHAPVFQSLEKLGLKTSNQWKKSTFARNEVPFRDPTGVDHSMLGAGLRRALHNFMLGAGLEEDVRIWFDEQVPRSTVSAGFVARALRS